MSKKKPKKHTKTLKSQAKKTTSPKSTTAKKTVKPRVKSKSKSRKGTKKAFPKFTAFFVALASIMVVAAAVAAQTIFKDLPSPRKLQADVYPVSTQIFDRNGHMLYEIYADTHRTPVTLDTLPEYVKYSTISIEDQDFYNHFGFSLQGIIRATRNTLFQDKLQGGSTITQQLVKTALLTPERTIRRKMREAVLTLSTEALYTKDEILEMYLNHIPYGGTAYGIEAASQRFFGKSSQDLTLPEASMLAGLPQAPSRYSPFTNPEQAKARQHEVLRRMVEDGYISQEEADIAFETNLAYTPPATDIQAPHFVFYIKSLLEEKYGLQKVERGGLRVTTTLDLDLQEYAQATVSGEIADLEDYKVGNGAALITKPNTGEILAMVGSKDYFDTTNDGQVNLTNRLRQPGSSIKPINYVTALQTKRLTPASMLLDYPTCFRVTGQRDYCPKNYDNTSHGPTQFRYALANSYNIPAVKVLAINGLESMIATASAMGITSFTDPQRYGLSLTLGGGEVTMLDMATAFGTLANQGVKVELQPILKVEDHKGEVLFEYHPEDTLKDLEYYFDEDSQDSNLVGMTRNQLARVLNREPAYLITDILSDNGARSAAFGSNSELLIRGQTVAVKTGTTNDLRDNWTIGYTPSYLIASWVGNNDNTPMNPYVVSGVTGAAPIWNSLMTQILSGLENEPQPEPPGLTKTYVCNVTGSYPTDDQPCDTRGEVFWNESTPKSYNTTKKNIWVFKDTGMPAFANTNNNGEPPPEVNPDSIELKEHTVVSDAFAQDYCLDCPWPQDDKQRIQYPVTYVNMSTFGITGSQNESTQTIPQQN